MIFVVEYLTQLIGSYGLFAVFLLMTAESALIPIPSEVTMPFAGFLAGRGIINFWAAVLIGATGNLLGSLLAYYLGYYKGEEWTREAIRKWGKFIFIKEKEYDHAKHWFVKYGHEIAFFSRLLPVVRTFISLPAGISRMGVKKFSFYTFLGSFIWSGILAYLGLKLGQNWQAIEPYFRKFQIVIVILAVLLVGVYVYRKFKKRD